MHEGSSIVRRIVGNLFEGNRFLNIGEGYFLDLIRSVLEKV
jgi:hypothetical protein